MNSLEKRILSSAIRNVEQARSLIDANSDRVRASQLLDDALSDMRLVLLHDQPAPKVAP